MCAQLDTTGLLADVTWALRNGQAEAGRERLHLYRRARGGYWMTVDCDWTLPVPRALYAEAHVGSDWSIESLVMRLSGPEQRDASFCLDGALWRGAIQTDQATLDRAVPFRPDMLVVFDSVGSATLALKRLKLTERQAQMVETVRIDLLSLEPVLESQQFECIGRESLVTPVGDFETLRFFSNARYWWADSRGILVAATGYRLLEYHWLES